MTRHKYIVLTLFVSILAPLLSAIIQSIWVVMGLPAVRYYRLYQALLYNPDEHIFILMGGESILTFLVLLPLSVRSCVG